MSQSLSHAVVGDLYRFTRRPQKDAEALRTTRREVDRQIGTGLQLCELPRGYDPKRQALWLEQAQSLYRSSASLLKKLDRLHVTKGWRDYSELSGSAEKLRSTIVAIRRRENSAQSTLTMRNAAEHQGRAILPPRRLASTQEGPVSMNYYREPIDSK
ncbi:hypothetical protein ACX9R5_18625 [Rathayibacter sp. CAU 1779]